MEKRVDVLGATARLQINEDNCGGFWCFCTNPCASATGLNFLESAIDSRRAGMSGLVWIRFDTAREGFRTSKDKQVETSALQEESNTHVHVQPACTFRFAGSHSNTHLHTCLWNASHASSGPDRPQSSNSNEPNASGKCWLSQEGLLNTCKSSPEFISELSRVLYAKEAPLQCCCLPRVVLVTHRKSHYSHTSSPRSNNTILNETYRKHVGALLHRCTCECARARARVWSAARGPMTALLLWPASAVTPQRGGAADRTVGIRCSPSTLQFHFSLQSGSCDRNCVSSHLEMCLCVRACECCLFSKHRRDDFA